MDFGSAAIPMAYFLLQSLLNRNLLEAFAMFLELEATFFVFCLLCSTSIVGSFLGLNENTVFQIKNQGLPLVAVTSESKCKTDFKSQLRRFFCNLKT